MRPALARTLGAALALAAGAASDPAPYARLEGEGADFLGPAAPAPLADTVRVGVVGPATGAAAAWMRAAVALALEEGNAGSGGPRVVALYRGDDGPWSSAAAAAVRLVAEEGALALIAGPDGARAHACELVAAKLWVPVLAPTAADHTVDYANVPWVFRAGPDDRALLRSLLDHAAGQGWRRLVWVGAAHRDATVARGTARRLAGGLGLELADPEGEGLESADAALVWAGLDDGAALVARVRAAAPGCPILAPWMLATPSVAAANGDAPLWLCVPATPTGLPPADFVRRLPAGTSPAGAWTAALTYDATALLAAAVRGAGAAPAAMRAALAVASRRGLSGPIAFDRLGGRRDVPLAVWPLAALGPVSAPLPSASTPSADGRPAP